MLINHTERVQKHLDNGEHLFNVIFMGDNNNIALDDLFSKKYVYLWLDDLGEPRVSETLTVNFDKPRNQFTLLEILNIDSRFLPFAVPVKNTDLRNGHKYEIRYENPFTIDGERVIKV